MKALRFADRLLFDPDYPAPKPKGGECLVRVHLAGICATDLEITAGYMNYQGVLGHEMVGTVEQGSARWKGKRVVCEINCPCGSCELCQSGLAGHCSRRNVMGITGRDGCFADLMTIPERNLHEVPSPLTDQEAVFVEPLAAAFQVLAQCPVDARMTVSVLGSGGLGLLVAQVLRDTKCKLTVIGRNPKTLLLCEKKSIQAIHIDDLAVRQDRDVIVDCTGSPDGLNLALKLVKPRGRIVLKSTYAQPGQISLAPLVVNEVTLLGSRCGPFPQAIDALVSGRAEVRSMISRTYPLENGLEAFGAARQPENVKVLLKINP